MCGHGAWLTWMDGRSVGTGGKRRAAGRNIGLGRRRGRGLLGQTGARVQASLGRLTGGADGQADGPNRARIARFCLVYFRPHRSNDQMRPLAADRAARSVCVCVCVRACVRVRVCRETCKNG